MHALDIHTKCRNVNEAELRHDRSAIDVGSANAHFRIERGSVVNHDRCGYKTLPPKLVMLNCIGDNYEVEFTNWQVLSKERVHMYMHGVNSLIVVYQ